MLTDGEDVGVVEGDVCTLRLGNVEIVALRVGRGVQRQERVRRVGSSVGDGEAKCK